MAHLTSPVSRRNIGMSIIEIIICMGLSVIAIGVIVSLLVVCVNIRTQAQVYEAARLGLLNTKAIMGTFADELSEVIDNGPDDVVLLPTKSPSAILNGPIGNTHISHHTLGVRVTDSLKIVYILAVRCNFTLDYPRSLESWKWENNVAGIPSLYKAQVSMVGDHTLEISPFEEFLKPGHVQEGDVIVTEGGTLLRVTESTSDGKIRVIAPLMEPEIRYIWCVPRGVKKSGGFSSQPSIITFEWLML